MIKVVKILKEIKCSGTYRETLENGVSLSGSVGYSAVSVCIELPRKFADNLNAPAAKVPRFEEMDAPYEEEPWERVEEIKLPNSQAEEVEEYED